MIEYPLEHHEEFSPYLHDTDCSFSEVRNIGWLHKDNEFITGAVPPNFLPKLEELIFSSRKGAFDIVVNQIRGFRSCPICGESALKITNDQGRSSYLGSAELWIPDKEAEGCYFATSSLIIHYVMEHQYQPPQAFIDSVLALSLDSNFNGEIVKDKLAEKYTGHSFSSLLEEWRSSSK
jgi:hypothetical protein